MKRIAWALAALLLLVSCSDEVGVKIVPGKLYVITTTRDNGCARFFPVSKKQWEGTYYVNTGSLYAVERKVTLKAGKKLVMIDPFKTKIPVLGYAEYEEPSFTPYPMTWEYRDSVYSVREMPDVPYARVKGYWSSFPDTGESNLQIFLSKVPSLIKTDLELTMDVYLPEDGGNALRPLLVFVHGGAFFNGDKASLGYPEWGHYFAGLGYVVASVNYRLGFHLTPVSVERAGFRAVQDVNAAIFRLLHDSDIYRVDPERIFVAGTSAGGITALNVAFMRDENIPASAKDEGGVNAINAGIAQPFSVRAVGNMWGAVEDTDILNNASTAIVSIHSTGDPIVPFGQDHPFEEIFGHQVIFPTMYGSSVITSAVGTSRATLHPYDLPGRHTLHIDRRPDGTEYLNARFFEIEAILRDFFSSRMLPHPVQLREVSYSNAFMVDTEDVKTLSWRVTGGVILQDWHNQIQVLFFPDADTHSVTASGVYNSGLTFYETIVL